MSTSRIVTVLARQAQVEHNPYLWDLAVMLYALETRQSTKQQPAARPAPLVTPQSQPQDSAQ